MGIAPHSDKRDHCAARNDSGSTDVWETHSCNRIRSAARRPVRLHERFYDLIREGLDPSVTSARLCSSGRAELDSLSTKTRYASL